MGVMRTMQPNRLTASLSWPPVGSAIGIFLVSSLLSFLLGFIVFPAFHRVPPGEDFTIAPGWVAVMDVSMCTAIALLSARSILIRNRDHAAQGTQEQATNTRAAALTFLTHIQRSDLALVSRCLLCILPVVALLAWLQTRSGFVITLEDWQMEAMSHPLSLLSTIALAPVAEELLFRGVLYGALARRGHRTAFLVTVAVSALAHWPPTRILGALPGVLLFTWLRQRTDRLAPSVIAHALYNALVMVGALIGGLIWN